MPGPFYLKDFNMGSCRWVETSLSHQTPNPAFIFLYLQNIPTPLAGKYLAMKLAKKCFSDTVE